MRPVDVVDVNGDADRGIPGLDELLVDGRPVEIGTPDRAAIRIDPRPRPVDVLPVDGDPDDGIHITCLNEALVHVRAIKPRSGDRPGRVVRPVDVAAAYCYIGRSL